MLLAHGRWVCLMRVWCLVILHFYCCFRLVSTVVANHEVLKPKYGGNFSDGDFVRKWTPFFGWRPTRKRYPKIEARKITSFGSVRWPNRFTFFFGSRNGDIRDGIRKRKYNDLEPHFSNFSDMLSRCSQATINAAALPHCSESA